MTYYRSVVTKVLETYLEFDDEERGDTDPDAFAEEISTDIPFDDWNIVHSEVETEEFDGELPPLR